MGDAKPGTAFRDYTQDSERYAVVRNTYHEKNTQMTLDFAKRTREEYLKFNKHELGVWEALELLSTIDDKSDPDTELSQLDHALQTAEALRAAYPDPEYDWLHLTGLIHDLGKVLKHPIFGSRPDWEVVGDTFPVGCKFSDSIPFAAETFHKNPDMSDARYNTELGMYEKNCGLNNIVMGWGHDEYMFEILKQQTTTLPEAALYIVKYHSFYAWHTSGDYDYLCNDKDREMLPWVQKFQKCDLYSKAEGAMDAEALKTYYKGLIEKYIPQKLKF